MRLQRTNQSPIRFKNRNIPNSISQPKQENNFKVNHSLHSRQAFAITKSQILTKNNKSGGRASSIHRMKLVGCTGTTLSNQFIDHDDGFFMIQPGYSKFYQRKQAQEASKFDLIRSTNFESNNIGMISPMRANLKTNIRRPKTVFKTMPPPNNTHAFKSQNIVSQAQKEKLFFSHKKVKSIMKKESMYQNLITQMNTYFAKKGLFSYVSANSSIKVKTSKDRKQSEMYFTHKRNDQVSHLDIRGLMAKSRGDKNRQKSNSSKHSLTENNLADDQDIKQIALAKFGSVQQKRSQTRVRNRQTIKIQKVRRPALPFEETWCFGRFKTNCKPDQINKLKIMYYKDFIWKVQFNNNFRYEIPKQQKQQQPAIQYKLFVGKGNNSRLINAIMRRRWWWTIECKQENANFIWTQLKISSIYQNQKECSQVKDFEFLNSHEDWVSTKIKSQDRSCLIMTPQKFKKWTQFRTRNQLAEKYNNKLNENMKHRKNLQSSIKSIEKSYPLKIQMTNHLQYSKMIGNKKALYWSMSAYAKLTDKQLTYIPLTFHIVKGLQDDEYMRFLPYYYKKSKQQGKTTWIVKPGQLSNRGNGIIVCQNLQQIKKLLKNPEQKHQNGCKKTYIVQQYINKPLLYKGRKFDIRHYIMITSNGGRMQGYFYKEGYIRTTCYKYNLKDPSPFVHLTNDAIQKNCKDYGRYEKGNKISYQQFDQYLKSYTQGMYSFEHNVFPEIKRICTQVIQAAFYQIDPKRREHNFQIFGLDIMIDQNIKPWLIQVNTNPCLALSSPTLAKIIPKMLDNAFTIAVDPIFSPPDMQQAKKLNIPDNTVMENQFQLVFDEILTRKTHQTKRENEINCTDRQNFAQDQQAFESGDDYQTQY